MACLKKPIYLFVFLSTILSLCLAQHSLSSAIERQFTKIENDLLTTAEAMPEEKFNFTPESLNLKGGNFTGVRTFAGQIKHLATDNIFMWSAITGDSVRADIEDVNGPKGITSKKEIINYLKESFALGRKAIATVTDQTPWT